MARHKILKSVLSYALVAGVLATSTLPSVMAHAETRNESAATTYAFVNKNTPGGVANFGRGSASITIEGNNTSQTLVGVQAIQCSKFYWFRIYKLYNESRLCTSIKKCCW